MSRMLRYQEDDAIGTDQEDDDKNVNDYGAADEYDDGGDDYDKYNYYSVLQ